MRHFGNGRYKSRARHPVIILIFWEDSFRDSRPRIYSGLVTNRQRGIRATVGHLSVC